MPRRFSAATSPVANLATCLTLLITILLLAILGSDTAQAQPPSLSDNLLNTPGPNGGARLGDFYYVYARNSSGQLQVRKTNGIAGEGSGTSWAALPALATDCYPAAAPVCNNVAKPIAQKISIIARRASDGQLMVTQTTTGDSGFAAWKVIPGGLGGVPGDIPGTKTDKAPAAVWFRPTVKATGQVDTTIGGVVVFYRNLRDGILYFTESPDGYNTWSTPSEAWGRYSMASGPTAVIETDQFRDQYWLYSLRVEHKTNEPSPLSGYNYQAILRDYDLRGTTGAGYNLRPMKSPANPKDPAIVATVGSIITEGDSTQWAGYYLPEVNTMRASVMKFHLSYDFMWNGGNSKFAVRWAEIRDCVNAGCNTIILRTPETPPTPDEMVKFMQFTTFPDQTGKSVASLAVDFPTVRWIIEVGNEPDHIHTNGIDLGPAFYRDRALALVGTGSVKPVYPQFKWIVSMPIDNGSDHKFAYSEEFVKTINGKSVLTEYDGVGIHAYTHDSLAWDNTAEEPLGALHFALARLPYGKFIHMSEIGMNSKTLAWSAKGSRFRNAMYAAPACVEGWEFFCTSAYPDWNTFTHYCIDKNYTDVQITNVTPNTVAGTNQDLTKITFNSTATYPAGTRIAIKNCWMKGPPIVPNPFYLLEGGFYVVAPPAPLAPNGPGVCWINRNTQGIIGVNIPSGQGWIDRYPLTTSSGRPGATEIGNR